MIRVWRIVRTKYANTAFTGEGAAQTGGRWNSAGTYVAYTSGTESLAALEILVHWRNMPTLDYVIFSVEFDTSLAQELSVDDLPPNWTVEPPGPATKCIGDDWVRKASSPVLSVPSVLIKSERNYLINPHHPHFSRLKINTAQHFSFDPRLLWMASRPYGQK